MAEHLLELAPLEEHSVLRALARRGGQQRDHVVDVQVVERVERQLQRLAAQQQEALRRRLAAVDRAV